MENHKKLMKSRRDKMIDGVCGGLAQFFGVNVAVVRLAFVLFAFFDLISVVAYITAMILVPTEPKPEFASETDAGLPAVSSANHAFFWGGVLIVIGAVMLLDTFNIFEFRWFWRHMGWRYVVPVILVMAGLILIFSRSKAKALEGTLKSTGDSGFRRRSSDKKIFGVCSGIAEHWNIDVTFVRVAWVVFTFIAFPIGIVLYGLIALLTTDEVDKKIYGAADKKS